MSPGRFFHALESGRLQCDLCPRGCTLSEGQRGFCHVRQRRGAGMELTVYGRPSAIAVDPIEKKPLAHFLPGSRVLSIGTTGCNLACKFCQNWQLSRSDATPPARFYSPEAMVDLAEAEACESVACTYNEPAIFAEYAIDVARACRRRGLRTVAVTAGYFAPEACKAFFADFDAANVDLKGFSPRFYRELCGGHLAPVLATLRYLARETSVWLELTTLLIAGQNDSEEELTALGRFVASELGADVPLHLSAFHPAHRCTAWPPTSLETLQRARAIVMEAGLAHVYLGNVREREGTRTHCAHCGALLLLRQGYALLQNHLHANGACPRCATPLAGRFAIAPS